jgi:hypothetical protein
LPTILFFAYNDQVHRSLGAWWLQQRLNAKDGDDWLKESTLGRLCSVEEAIAVRAGLNSYVHTTSRDAYTLLILACMSDSTDAVQRLLLHGSVDIHLGSKKREWTALFVCARNGYLHTAQLLIEHGADARLAVGDGQTPLFIAAAKGHTEVVALLRQNGAEDGCIPGWMGLTAVEGARATRRLSKSMCEALDVQQENNFEQKGGAGLFASCVTDSSLAADSSVTSSEFRQFNGSTSPSSGSMRESSFESQQVDADCESPRPSQQVDGGRSSL